jgi:hypothetical protein
LFPPKIPLIMFKRLFNLFLRLRYGKPEKSTAQSFEDLGQVTYPEEGGIDTYHQGSKYPFPGFISTDDLDKLAHWKRLVPLGVDFLQHQLRPFIPSDPKLYSKPVREIYRIFTLMMERHHDFGPRTTFQRIRDIVCILMERDDAYRFPIQDGLSELDLNQIKMDDRELYWACNKPYDFGGEANKENMVKIRQERFDYELAKAEELELDIQEGMEKQDLEKQKIHQIGKTLVPDLNAVLEKHGLKPDFSNPTEKQVDLKLTIKIPE